MYSKNEDEIFKILNSNIDGLNSKETKKRINDYGQNIIINKMCIRDRHIQEHYFYPSSYFLLQI